jgi:acetyl-CoA carboxylase biotin carboxyl carrier protein
MDFKSLEKFIELAKANGCSKLSFEKGEDKYSVSFGHEGTVYQTASAAQLQTMSPMAQAVMESGGKEKQVIPSNLKEIKSPFVGTFYRTSSPGSDPFVKLGDKVAAGKTLCIIEAMKIMNEIEADFAGEVVEICVENETYVEYGQTLFRLK